HFKSLLAKMEKRFNVSTGSNEMMVEEEPPEEYTNSMKEFKEINETRGNLGLPPLPFDKISKR
ncbi:MAG TPA: hypothetical protein VMW36_08970, partial [Patescibacteria group bacterium]|nr:hypothetical protein [Patescibacteria group bacterium]